MSVHPKKSILKLHGYKPNFGKSNLKKVIHLSANENPLGCSKKISNSLNKNNFNRYPPQLSEELISSIAKKHNLDKNKIILGNGSDELISIIAQSYLNVGDEAIYTQYGFLQFPQAIAVAGGRSVVAKDLKLTVSIDNILKKVTKNTRLIFLANPNNPTGTYLDRNEMLELRKRLRSDILLVVDDAYCEFIEDPNFASGIELFSKSKNVLITRTFSKIYGLAGLRIGWGYSSKAIIQKLYEIKPPFNVSRPALFAATQAVQDINWLNKAIKHNNYWSEKIFDVIDEIGIATNKTNVNFFLLNFDFVDKSSSQVFNKLANSGILVRQMNVYGIKNSLRVTIGNSNENKKFITTLRKIFNV